MSIREYVGTPSRPGRKGYTTVKADTPEDAQKLRGSEMVLKIVRDGKDKLEAKKEAVLRDGERVVYPTGRTMDYLPPQAAQARATIAALTRGKVPASRFTIRMGAHVETLPDGRRVVVRDEE